MRGQKKLIFFNIFFRLLQKTVFQRDFHLPKSYPRKHAGTVEEINENAHEGMHLVGILVLGLAPLELIVALEIAHLHDSSVQFLRRATA